MSIRTVASAVLALVALFLVALAPTGAAAHGSVPHVHAAKPDAGMAVVKGPAVAVTAELRAWSPLSANDRAATDCGDRGCCSAGHCSGCGIALAPAAWSYTPFRSDVVLLNPDISLPASLAREGPPRPPKFFA